MAAIFINASFEPFAHAWKKPGYIFVSSPPVDCVAIFHQAGIPIRVIRQLERDKVMYPSVSNK